MSDFAIMHPTDCFICWRLCSGNENYLTSASFQLLMKYLGVKRFQRFDNLMCLNSDADCGLSVNLCEDCLFRINEFGELYREFEVARLFLDKCVQCFYDLMKVTHQCGNKEEGDNQEKEKLRKNTMEKCALKVGEMVPRVKLKKFALVDNQGYNLEQPLLQEDKVKVEVDVISEELEEHHGNLITCQLEGGCKVERNCDDTIFCNESQKSFSNSSFTTEVSNRSETINLAIHPTNYSMHYEGEEEDAELESRELISTPSSSFQSVPMETYVPTQFQSVSFSEGIPPPPPSEIVNDDPLSTADAASQKGKDFSCSICSKMFENRKLLLYHRRRFHYDFNPSSSPAAPTTSKYLKKDNGFICYYCQQQGFQSKQHLRWHMIKLHFFQFYSSVLPRDHSDEHILAVTRSLVDKHKPYSPTVLGCPYCLKCFSDRSLLRVHIQEKHIDKILLALKNPYDEALLPLQVTHERPRSSTTEEHSSLIGSSQCNVCQISFETSLLCRIHSVVSHPVAILGNLPPETTDLQVKTSLSSILHEVSSLSVKPTCSICGIVRDSVELLHFHILTNHIDKVREGLEKPENKCSISSPKNPHHSTEVSLSKCPHCSKLYNKCNYAKHIMLNHPFHFYQKEIPPGTSEEEVEEVINQVLSDERVVVDHNGSNRHGCPHCKISYCSIKELRNHVITYHFNKIVALIPRTIIAI